MSIFNAYCLYIRHMCFLAPKKMVLSLELIPWLLTYGPRTFRLFWTNFQIRCADMGDFLVPRNALGPVNWFSGRWYAACKTH